MQSIISALNGVYSTLGISQSANAGDVLGLSGILFILVGGLFLYTRDNFGSTTEAAPSKPAPSVEPPKAETPEVAKPEVVKEEAQVAPKPQEPVKKEPTVSWTERLKKGLGRSRKDVWGKLEKLFTGNALGDDQLEEIEELLYGADLGPSIATSLIGELESKARSEGFGQKEFKQFLFDFLKQRMEPAQSKKDEDLFNFNKETHKGTKTIMVVGVNGAGKTTTIGKLATKLTGQGAKVVVGACDTFRAAAVDQLQVWCERAGAQMIRAKEGANPSGVGYDALQQALNEEADYCILDTAGRLHTKGNLMDELTKSKEVLRKLDENAPDHCLLVIDAITGQNAMRQAKEFNQALDITGLIFTKCDGSSKAGSAVGIVQELNVPITYIGVGESVEDLDAFHLDEYLHALLDTGVGSAQEQGAIN